MAHSLELTQLAARDYEHILDYTWQTWGEGQYRRYRDRLRRGMATIAEFPLPVRSKAREDLFPGARTYPTGRHHLVYFISDQSVILVRILHQQMDLPRHLEGTED